MTATLQVKCVVKKDVVKDKEIRKEIKEKDIKDVKEKEHKDGKEIKEKDIKDFKDKEHKDGKEIKEKDKDVKEHKDVKEVEKPIHDGPGKPVTDKTVGLDKGFDKPSDGRPGGGGLAGLEARIAALESMLGGQAAPQPFIGAELRPDLSQSAYFGEEDVVGRLQEQMRMGSGHAKRAYDVKPGGR